MLRFIVAIPDLHQERLSMQQDQASSALPVPNQDQAKPSTKNWADNPQFRPFAYFLALTSILPVLGVLIGLASIAWGLATLDRGGKVIAIIGLLGFSSQTLTFMYVLHLLAKTA